MFTKHNFLGQVCRLMRPRQIDYRHPSTDWATNPPIASILPAKVYKGLASQMGKDKVHWLLDVATDDGQALASWSEVKQRHNIRGLIRNWYLELCKVICTPEEDVEATSDDDVEDVVEALEVEEVEPFEVVEPLEVVELVEAAAMVAVNARASTESDTDSEPLEDPRQRRRAERALQTATVAGTPD
ncbi:hypothetical protein BGZ75_002541, partial [Mortierella antarctica]